MYIVDQGTVLRKKGNRLVVEKKGEVVSWVHAHKIEQVVLLGNIFVSPSAVNYLLKHGIDTVFLSFSGKYQGRLVAQFGKNVLLRQAQFNRLSDPAVQLELAQSYVFGKLQNSRTLLRRHNQDLQLPQITEALHAMRRLIERVKTTKDLDTLRGIEGKGTAIYFQGFRHAIKAPDMSFGTRSRRPPRDAVNVLLSFGYTLLANTIQTAAAMVGFDPYLGCLHSIDYGRPSMVLDLMEEFRPVLVDSLVLRVVNKRIITPRDFFYQEDAQVPPEGEELEELDRSDYPILLSHQGMKKFITHYETRLNERALYPLRGQILTYRQICIEQARLLARHLKGEDTYKPFLMR
ncbi:MAG: CRISPR-associated endonuclease Cas1 [Candidatus Syntropharchaeia archaeon]